MGHKRASTPSSAAARSGGNLQASAGNNLAIIASQVHAGGDLALAAEGDMLIASSSRLEAGGEAYLVAGD